MRNEYLKRFINDEELSKAVQEALLDRLKRDAANKAIKGESTEGIKDAYEAIQNTIKELKKEYLKKETVTRTELPL